MKYEELISEAKLGNDIHLSIPTFSKCDEYEKILKPFGYKLCNISSYIGKPNVIFKKK